MLVDSHCHLNFPDYKDDLDAVIARAHEAGVGVMQTICTKSHEFLSIRAIAEKYDDIYCSVGIHPHEAGHDIVSAEQLVEWASHPKVIGIGETGLDFFYEHSPRTEQEESFRRHIAASRITKLPIIIHTRDADEETVSILRDEMRKGAFPGLIHCFSTSQQLADSAVELGLYISISGIVSFKKAEALRDSIKTIPLNRILVETDAPFLAPIPYRGKRNEPAYVAETNKIVAELKGVSPEECARVTTQNFFDLFTKAKRPQAWAA